MIKGRALLDEPSSDNRRPLNSRSWPVMAKITRSLAGLGVTPNQISALSMVFALLAAICMYVTSMVESEQITRLLLIAAAMGIQLRLLANLWDGMIAVESGRKSVTGPLWNELPDRVSDPLILVAAGYAYTGDPVAGWLAALAAMWTAYLRSVGAELAGRHFFQGPMAKPQRMAVMTVTLIAICAMPQDWHFITEGVGLLALALWLIVAGCVITCIRRCILIVRALHYQNAMDHKNS